MADVGIEKRLAVFERDGYMCQCCGFQSSLETVLALIERAREVNGRQPSRDRLTIDHIVPRGHGGTNAIWNLQTLCGRCNNQKGATIPEGVTSKRKRKRGGYDLRVGRYERSGRLVRRKMGSAAGVGLLREHPALVALSEQLAAA